MRKLIEDLESAFERTHQNTIDLFKGNSYEDLFETHSGSVKQSPGLILIRSAAVVEQCFGGITSRLWDDPFEWTLPETLTGSKQVLEYLSEVKEAREGGANCQRIEVSFVVNKSETIYRQIFVSGKVQGVFFRESTRQFATELKLSGGVRNLRDGRVEAVLEGDTENVTRLVEWAHGGPANAIVEDIEIRNEKFNGEFSKFDVAY